MQMRYRWVWLLGCLIPLVALAPVTADPDSSAADEQTLQSAGLRTDGAALLDFLRQRSHPLPDRDRLWTLARQLMASSRSEGDRAAAALLAIGPAAIPALRLAAQDPDDRAVWRRASRCLQQLQATRGDSLPVAVVRLVAQRKPAGAAEALLGYLPFADDEMVLRETQSALAAVAVRDDKPDPLLLRALEDPIPLRRAVAAELIAGSGAIEHRPALLRLLKDPKPLVRLRVALALGHVHTEEAIPVLITLLAELPAPPARNAEEFLINLAAEQAPKAPLGTTEATQTLCRDAWMHWWTQHDGPTLLDEFRKRTLTDAQRDQVLALIRQLGDESFEVRERTMTELMKAGKPAVFLLRQALNDADAEVSQRAQKCIQGLDKEAVSALPAAIPRLVALRKPPGAAKVLLAHMPFVDDEGLQAEVHRALVALAWHDGKPEPVLMRGLGDPVAPRRAAAAAALCEAGGPNERALLRKLLADPDASVRFRVALGLAARAGDREAIPALINLLGKLPPEQNWQAEDYLYRLAGEQAPKVSPATDADAWQKVRAAWGDWWREQGPRITVVKLDPTQALLGYNLFVLQENNGSGKVMELSPSGKMRWQITGLQMPVDARVIPGNKVLIVEHGNRVTERDFQGKVLMTVQDFTDQPVNAQRLFNGHTFITVENELRELDRAGKRIFSLPHPQADIMSGFKFRDGQMAYVTRRNQCHRLDATGKEVKTFRIQNVTHYGGIDGLDNGRLLVPHYHTNKVMEYDLDGNVVWEVNVPSPCSATRLPNGHTLVVSNNQRVIELDRSGRTVWEYKDGTRLWRIRRR